MTWKPISTDFHPAIQWSLQSSHVTEVVVFGSQATGHAEIGSDLDLLCVGDFDTSAPRFHGVDIITTSAARFGGVDWLGSELNHVAAFGIRLKGEMSWRDAEWVSPNCVERKRARVLQRWAALLRHQVRLSDAITRRSLRLIGYDLQRLLVLSERPVPSRQMLGTASVEHGHNLAARVRSYDLPEVRLSRIFREELGEERDEHGVSRGRNRFPASGSIRCPNA